MCQRRARNPDFLRRRVTVSSRHRTGQKSVSTATAWHNLVFDRLEIGTEVEFVMDAEHMQFADNSFDKVVALYVVSVVSVVPSPAQLVAEMRRVCRPGGELYIVNHFQHANPFVAGMERLMTPLSRLLGFHPNFPLENFLRETGLEVTERVPVNLLGYWTLLHASNNKVPTATAARKHSTPRMRAV